jgi:hypothetical protein
MYYALFSTFSIELFVVIIVTIVTIVIYSYDTILCVAGFSGLWSILLALGAHLASCS